MTSLILASTSPRRRELLTALGLDFSIRAVPTDETPRPYEKPRAYVERCATAKAMASAAAAEPEHSVEVVIAADTIVEVDGKILGKPTSPEHAARMLASISGRRHLVLTAVAIAVTGKGMFTDIETTTVHVAQLSESEIEWYIATGEPDGKAGAYAIQGMFSLFVERISGNYSNVVGLPMPLVYRLLKRAGVPVLDLLSVSDG